MNLRGYFPYLVAVFVICVGLFFIVTGFIGHPYLEPRPPGNRYLFGISIFFVVIGLLAVYFTYKGKLKKIGITTADVRRETVAKLADQQLLAKIALEDENRKVRETAAERLKEIKD